MDTVSMLNTMSFYCQPILPLVYDESMSYYETLCKVVGQLNTTGETVNKLNEGLTGEIADRQAADASLDERLTGEIAARKAAGEVLDARIKQIEETNSKIHFLKIDTLGNLLTPDVTRENLSQWIQDGDLIAMLYAPDEQENSWAVATNYRCLGARGAETMQISFYVPISIVHNSGKSGSDVAQEVVVISLPVGELTNQWVVRSITTTIPATNADGFVNLTATVGDAGAVTCDVAPGAIVDALRNYFSGTNQYAVAVNARLNYDGKQYHSASAIVKADASGSGNIRIEFENYYNGVRAENGVSQMNTETIFIVGDVSTNAWSVETIDHKAFDFSRYEGFQFTRGENNVITANDESTPNAVYAQFHSDNSGKLYQNLPVRLIDTVDNAEYWNGTFHSYSDGHMTFTFVTSNYTTESNEMLVKIIELSATKAGSEWADSDTWKYGVQEFRIPIKDVVTYTASTVGEGEYDATRHKTEYQVDFAEGVPAIIASIEAGNRVILRADLNESGSELGATPLYFASGYTRIDIFSNAISYVFSGSISNGHYTLELNSGLAHATLTSYGEVLPEPNPDGTDNGKVPIVNGAKWGLKTLPNVAGAGAVRYDAKQTLTFEQQKQARRNIDAAPQNTPNFTGYITLTPPNGDMGHGVGMTASVAGGGHQYALNISDVDEQEPTLLTGVRTPTDTDTNAAATVEYVMNKVAGSGGGSADAVLYIAQTLTDAQKKQARENIDAASDFVVNGTVNSKREATLDKTHAQIQTAIQEGKHPVVHIAGWSDNIGTVGRGDIFLPLVAASTYEVVFSAVLQSLENDIQSVSIVITTYGDIYYYDSGSPSASEIATKTYVNNIATATKKYVDGRLPGAPITIKLGTGNAATSTATFDEIRAALEAGKAPILDSAPGTSHWFALNWTLSGPDRLTIQYGTFNVDGGGKANFTITDVGVSSTGITYVGRQFTSE